MYELKLEHFEGPFDLLIDLIDQKKLSINKISLAEVANQYLAYIEKIEKFPVREVTFFVVVASTLMLIKSRSLMPTLEISGEEEVEIENLEKQLRLYKQFRTLALELEKIFGKKVIFARESFLQVQPIFVEPKDLSLEKIRLAVENLINNLPQKEPPLPQTLIKKTISLEQKMDDLIKKLQSRVTMCFSEMGQSSECDKVDLIVGFLAVLELTRRGFIIIKQDMAFGEIEITKQT